jgi:hypothetical protein
MKPTLSSFPQRISYYAVSCLLAMFAASPLSTFSQPSPLSEATFEVTLNTLSPGVPDTLGSPVTVGLYIISPDSLALASINEFSFAIAYDSDMLTLSGVEDSSLDSVCGWFTGWTIEGFLDTLGASGTLLWYSAEKTSDVVPGLWECLTPGEPLITLQFTPRSDTFRQTTTTLDFYWRDCNDNAFWTTSRDTAFLARQVINAKGVDITDDTRPMPSYFGPDSSCLDPPVMAVLKTIRFQSAAIVLKNPTDVAETCGESNIPTTVTLRQNYPNPFNPTTTIEFSLAQRSTWKLEIFNLNGQIVAEFSGAAGPSVQSVIWNGRDRAGHLLSSGVYFYRLTAGEYHISRKMLLLK